MPDSGQGGRRVSLAYRGLDLARTFSPWLRGFGACGRTRFRFMRETAISARLQASVPVKKIEDGFTDLGYLADDFIDFIYRVGVESFPVNVARGGTSESCC